MPNEAIGSILHDLFDHFNFTVTETTPLDIEVAVDPEMLGKVFEELVPGRHEKGSYYNAEADRLLHVPRSAQGISRSQLAKREAREPPEILDEQDPGSLLDPEAVLEALRRVRVCDPAMWQRRLLLGMLHEVMDLHRVRELSFQASGAHKDRRQDPPAVPACPKYRSSRRWPPARALALSKSTALH